MILRLIWESIRQYAAVVLSYIFEPVFWIMLIILFMQYKKLEEVQKDVYGVVKYRKRDMLASSILAGILGGMFTSIIVATFGITFNKLEGVIFLLLLSILMMVILDPHFICLSYSGGIVSLISLLLTYLNTRGIINIKEIPIVSSLLNFDVSAILILVALLHLVEATLMYFDGARYPIPMFFKRNGRILGGFLMTRFWTIPLMILILVSLTPIPGDSIPTPDWWPLIRPAGLPSDLREAVFSLTPLLAILGYGDFTVSQMPKQKVKKSSLYLFLFSIILFALSVISIKIYAFKYIAAIFSPIAHELIIILNRRKELTSKYLWEYSYDGVKVLDVVPNSPAEKMGLKSGYKIIAINNKRVNNLYDAQVIINEADRYLWVDAVDLNGKIKKLEFYNYKDELDSIGIISIPQAEGEIPIMDMENTNIFKRKRR